MAAGDVLEMLDKHVVDDGATRGSDQGNHFGGGFFRDNDTEPTADRADQLYEGRWLRHTALAQLRQIPAGFCNGCFQRQSEPIVTGIGRIIFIRTTAQGKDFRLGHVRQIPRTQTP